MKELKLTGVFIVALLGLVAIGSKTAFGDDLPVASLSMSVDAGADMICTGQLAANVHYAVQPTVNANIGAFAIGDGGVLSDGGIQVTTANMLVGSGKLYDIWTTTDRRYICCKPAANGAPALCNVFKFIALSQP
jgi:hypothetical protein